MPIYEYRCPTCDHGFDVLKKMSDPVAEACPRCQAAAERCISAPSPTRKVKDVCLGGRPMTGCCPSTGGCGA